MRTLNLICADLIQVWHADHTKHTTSVLQLYLIHSRLFLPSVGYFYLLCPTKYMALNHANKDGLRKKVSVQFPYLDNIISQRKAEL